MRKAFVVFAFYVGISATYLVFQLVQSLTGVAAAVVIAGIVFGVTALMIDWQLSQL